MLTEARPLRIADRAAHFDSSGFRRMFRLARELKNPVNLSIGQPDFPVPDAAKAALHRAVAENQNGYTPTEGIPPLVARLHQEIQARWPHPDRRVIVTSGTSGGLSLALLALVNPGDEVIYFDPCFSLYPAVVSMVGGVRVPVLLNDEFQIDPDSVAAAITPRTRVIICNSPCNPTGVCYPPDQLRALAELADRHDLCLVSDEIYSQFAFDGPHRSPAEFSDRVLVVDGFSKSAAMTGLRVGWAHGPAALVETMARMQQFTYVCAPAPAQWAALAAMDVDVAPHIATFRRRRDRVMDALTGHYEVVRPGGAFYVWIRLPWGTGEEFLQAAIARELLLIPGTTFGSRDTHFRISIAVDDATLDRGLDRLLEIARPPRG